MYMYVKHFYSASALLAMQTAVIATADLSSVRLSVCLCVTFRCFVQTNEDTTVRSSASGRTSILVSGEIKLIRYSQGATPSKGLKVTPIASENLTYNQP